MTLLVLGHAAPPTGAWAFHLHPDVIVLVGLLVWSYAFAIRRLGPRLAPPGEPVVARRQMWLFGGGAALVLMFASWPVHDISEEYLFSVHMLQHTVFSLIAPPLLLLGCPRWLVSWITRPIQPALRKLCRPVPASLVFNGVIAVTHWPAWVNYTVQNEWAHFLAHSLLFGAALVMWLPVVNRLAELPTMTPPGRMFYLFLQSILPTVPASFLVFADAPLYSSYANAPRLLSWTAVEDQQVAGAIMKLGGTTIIWTVIVVMFFRWYAENSRRDTAERHLRRAGEVLTWEAVERELERTEPARSEPAANRR